MSLDKQNQPKNRSWRTRTPTKVSRSNELAIEDAPESSEFASQSWKSSDFQRTILDRVFLWTSRLLITTATIALLAFLVQLLLTLHRPIPIVTAIASGYQAPLGPIPLTEEDKGIIFDLNSPGTGFFAPIVATIDDISPAFAEIANGQDFLPYITRALEKARPGGPNRDTVVVYIAAVATIDKSGQPLLVPPLKNADPLALSDNDFISVERLLTAIRASVQPNVNVVTILDCGKDEQSWPFGLTGIGFPAAVESVVERGNIERLWVVLPSSTGQRILTSQYLGGSSFTTHFARGLQGAADLKPYGNTDGKVSLLECSEYLKYQVDHCAASIFGSRQTPKLVSASSPLMKNTIGADQVMLSWSKKSNFQLKEHVPSVAGVSWLNRHWQAVDQIRESQTGERPVRWASYQNLLLRSERLRRYGKATAEAQGVNDAYTEQLESILQLPLTYLEYVLLDQDLASIQNTLDNEQQIQLNALDALLQDTTKPIKANPSDIDAWQTRLKQGWQLLLSRIASGKIVSRDYLQRWLAYIGPSPGGDSLNCSQLHFVRMLTEWTPPTAWNYSQSLFSDLIQCVADTRRIALGWSVRLDRSPSRQQEFDQATNMLRRAIDLTFAGDENSIQQADQLSKQVRNDLQSIETKITGRWNALKTLDRLKGELPYLLDWWSREKQVASGQQQDSKLQDSFITDLLVSVRQYYRSFERLATNIDPANRDSNKQMSVIQKHQQVAEKNFKRFLNTYRDSCRNLVASGTNSPQTLGSIRRALITPLIPADVRIELIKKSDRIEQQLVKEYKDSLSQTTEPLEKIDEPVFVNGAVQLKGSFVFPVAAQFLRDYPQQNTKPSTIEDFAQFIGRQASALRDISRSFETYGANISKEVSTAAQQQAKDSHAILAILERASAYNHREALLVCDRLKYITGNDPEISYFANLIHRRLIRLSKLTLDDFWNSVDAGRGPFCLLQSRRLFDLAQIAADKYGAERDDLIVQEFEERLGNAESSVDEFSKITLSPPRITLAPVSSQLPSSLAVKLQPSPGIPEGLATISFAPGAESNPLPLLQANFSSRPLTRVAVALGNQSALSSWTLDATTSRRLEENEVPALDFVVWYRGHKMITGIPVVPASASRDTKWQAQSSEPSKITVHGDVSQPQAVAIIFDCSGSMGRRMGDGRTRLDAGRSAVQQVLDNLVSSGDWDVSLWLYGHRTQWSRDENGIFSFALTELGERAKENAKKNDQPFNLVPGDDVEQVLPMQPLTKGVALEIDSILSPLAPGGETPLYRAISEAIGTDFDGSHRSIPGHILVVTDGANDQSGGQFTTASGVTRQLAQKNIRRPVPLRIDVIGFALETDAMERALRMAEVRDVAHNSGGKFYEAADPTELLKSLRDSFRLLQWRVSGPNAVNKTFHLEDTYKLPLSLPQDVVNYDVFLETGSRPPTRRFAAENNTSLDLYVANGGRSIEFRRYDGGTEQGLREQRSSLIDPIDPRRKSFFGVHVASRTTQGVRIPVSIQNDESTSYSQRPKSIWIEIQPLKQNKPTGTPYVFYDMELQKNRPVPVFNLNATQWPRLATKAAIKGWFRFDQIYPDLSIPITRLSENSATKYSFPGLPECEIYITRKKPKSDGTIEISVIEQHPVDQFSHLPTLKVCVPTNCLSANHRVEPDIGKVCHTFIIKTNNTRVSENVCIEFTDKQRLINGATNTISQDGTPLIIPVPTQ